VADSKSTDGIAEWRKRIDEIDRQLVGLINERAKCAREVGRLKRHTEMPIYEPDRERKIFENVHRLNQGPLPDQELTRVYERLIEAMRKLQEDEMRAGQKEAAARKTEAENGD